MVRVSLHLTGRLLSVHIQDGDSRLPVPRPQPELGETGAPDWTGVDGLPEAGYGLNMVQVLAAGLGCWPLPNGKIVVCWFHTGAPTQAMNETAGKAGGA